MPKGKRAKSVRISFPPLEFKPRVCVIGHSMPKRLFKAFDLEAKSDGTNQLILNGSMTRAEAYARYLYVDQFITDVKFFHTPLVCDKKFDEAVLRAAGENPEIVIFHVSSNDLAAKKMQC